MRSTTGATSAPVRPIQSASTERSIGTPCRAMTTACRFSGMCSECLATAIWASSASVGQLPSRRWAGALACVTPARPLGQAYLGRIVTITW